jgi:amphi-Trp domain-containing protein
MADRTSREDVMTRGELASYLTDLAREFDESENGIDVTLGNKTISLSPPEDLNVSIDVIERSSRLRGSRETVTIEMDWKP